MPDVGIVVLEVKGGAIWYDDGWWQTAQSAGPADRPGQPGPRVEVRRCATTSQRDPRWGSRTYVAWGHGVVTPQQDWPDDFSLPDLPRWALHGCSDLDDLAERVRENARRLQHGKQPPTHDDVELIADILAGRRATSYDVNAEAQERADRRSG